MPVPSHRQEYKNISIEMLYTNQDLARTNDQGKRLYFDNELEKRIAPDNRITYVTIAPLSTREQEKKVSSEPTEQIVDAAGNQKALSKARFAELVYNQASEFQGMDFSAFVPIFEMINHILGE